MVRHAGILQIDLARRLKIRQAHLSSVAKGARIPSLDLAIRLQEITGGAVRLSSWPHLARVIKDLQSIHEQNK